MRYSPSGILIAFLVLGACQQDLIINADLPEPQAELVVNSLFQPDSLWEVYVNTSTPLVGAVAPDAVASARVEILEGEQVIEVLPFDKNFFIEALPFEGTAPGGRVARYRSQTTRPEAGKRYGIRVAAEGYEAVTGTDAVPHPVPIIASTFTDNVGTDEVGTLAEVRLTFADPPGETNYYNLRVHQRGFDKNRAAPSGSQTWGFSIISDLQDDFFGADPNDFLGNGEIFEAKEDGVTFSDVFFDGQRKEVVLQVRGGATCGFVSAPDDSLVCQAVVELSTVTEAFYRYHRTLQLQNEAAENPFAEPVRILSNMNNDIGIFAGYNTDLWIHERPFSQSGGLGE